MSCEHWQMWPKGLRGPEEDRLERQTVGLMGLAAGEATQQDQGSGSVPRCIAASPTGSPVGVCHEPSQEVGVLPSLRRVSSPFLCRGRNQHQPLMGQPRPAQQESVAALVNCGQCLGWLVCVRKAEEDGALAERVSCGTVDSAVSWSPQTRTPHSARSGRGGAHGWHSEYF